MTVQNLNKMLPKSFVIPLCLSLLITCAMCDYKMDSTYYTNNNNGQNDTLKLVHVIFRHGDRTNIKTNVYPNDPHKNVTYYPIGFGQLTKKGKRVEYILGKHLRDRYDEFLGMIYTPRIVDARSSDTNRTKMSLELVLAGLFPPVGDQIWDNSINWQPIPYNFYPKEMDKGHSWNPFFKNVCAHGLKLYPNGYFVATYKIGEISSNMTAFRFNRRLLSKDFLEFFGVLCPTYKKARAELKNSPQYLAKMSQYRSLFEYLTSQTGQEISDDVSVFKLYNGMVVEEENGLVLPAWTRSVYPQPLKDISINLYFTDTSTPIMKKLGAGYLLRKIVNDSLSSIEGVPTLRNRKMYLYSGHEFNVAFFLITLGIFKPQIPPYGSHILIELHQIDGIYGFKVFFHDYTSDNPPPLVIPGCEDFCPLDRFIYLLDKYIPTDAECGRTVPMIS